MLILTRRLGERLVIGENGEIKVTILAIKGNQIRLGVEAPKEITVHREEIYERIKAEEAAKKEKPKKPENTKQNGESSND